MAPMIAASAISPSMAEATPATSRIATNGFKEDRIHPTSFERSRGVASSLKPWIWRSRSTSCIERPAASLCNGRELTGYSTAGQGRPRQPHRGENPGENETSSVGHWWRCWLLSCSPSTRKLDEAIVYEGPQFELKVVRYYENLPFHFVGEVFSVQCGSARTAGSPGHRRQDPGWVTLAAGAAIGSKSAAELVERERASFSKHRRPDPGLDRERAAGELRRLRRDSQLVSLGPAERADRAGGEAVLLQAGGNRRLPQG